MDLDKLNKDALFLVDGSGFIFRAFFAMPKNLTNPKGQPVGAVMGFVNMLMKLLFDIKAARVIVVFDAGRKTFRNDIYDKYKANRSETPPDLIPQFPLFRDAAQAFGLNVSQNEGFEADDLIAAYAKKETDNGGQVVIVGSDKDLYQLVGDNVVVLDTMKQIVVDEKGVREKFGVNPSRVIDVQALAGDTSDNIPGVAGIGLKTAAQLVLEHGSLEGVLAAANEIKQPKRRAALIENADLARISMQLVTLDKNAPTDVDLSELSSPDLTSEALKGFLKEHGFNSILGRVGAVSKKKEASQELSFSTISTKEALQQYINKAKDFGKLGLCVYSSDKKTSDIEIVGIALSCGLGDGAYIPISHKSKSCADVFSQNDLQDNQLDLALVLKELREILSDKSVLKIGHDFKLALKALKAVEINAFSDIMLLAYALGLGGGKDIEVNRLALGEFGTEKTKYSDVVGSGAKQLDFAELEIEAASKYACDDVAEYISLYDRLYLKSINQGTISVYEDIDRPIVPIIADMESCGICLDKQKLASLSSRFGCDLIALEEKIYKLANGSFNIGSPKQVAQVLFERLALSGGKKTKKTGAWSTSADILESLASDGSEIAQLILDWRGLSKLKSTYADALPKQISPIDGRIHTSFSLALTATGRFSSHDPNLQNIPARSQDGREVRSSFISKDGCKLVAVDYSQVELRVAAALADVPYLKEAFFDGRDIHSATAQEVFGEVTKASRMAAKTVNFGVLYGISAFGLARQLNCDRARAAEIIKLHNSRFPQIVEYMEAQKQKAFERGYVETLFGRRCVISGAQDGNPMRRAAAGRQAGNAPIQGTAADIMKIAMRLVDRAILQNGLKSKMLLQVHDELLFEAPLDEVEALAKLVCNEMEGAANIGVPLIANSSIGSAWGVWE